MNWNKLAKIISQKTAEAVTIENATVITGGCINTAYKIETLHHSYFVKFNSTNKLKMFESEYDGLLELAKTEAIRIPVPVCTGILEQQSYLVMEYLNLNGNSNMAMLGEQLANLHRTTSLSKSYKFGWHLNNYIGTTSQINTSYDSWQTFWAIQRLGFQFALAKHVGASSSLLDKGERLQADMNKFFMGYEPKPSLLHGDLWSGNIGFIKQGEAVIFDPAVYYGDRECDLAMTELFGGFSKDFYSAYEQSWPLDDGYKVRKDLYNLYHILNHFNLFGGGYEPQAENYCDRLLAEV